MRTVRCVCVSEAPRADADAHLVWSFAPVDAFVNHLLQDVLSSLQVALVLWRWTSRSQA